MKTVFALQLGILSPEGTTPASCLREIERLIVDWIRQKYQRAWNISFEPDFSGQSLRPQAGHECVAVQQSSGEFHLTTLDWIHPDDEDASISWRISCILASDPRQVETSVVIRIASEQFLVKPAKDYITGRPRIIDTLVRAYRCEIQGQSLSTEAQRVTTENVGQFITSVLESGSRALPVVALSRDAWTEYPYVDANDLQKTLLGLAQVVVLDKYASFELTAAVGKQLSCFNGAIRVYWPGFSPSADPWKHPLYMPGRMRELEAEGSPISQYLFFVLSDIAALRFADGPVTRAVQLHLQKAKADEIAQLRQQLDHRTLGEDQLETQLLKAWDDLQAKSNELEKAQEQIQELEREVAQQKENWAALSEYRPTVAYGQTGTGQKPPVVKSVVDALDEAEARFGDRLCIWDSARRAAAKSYFGRPMEVFDALEAIAELGSTYFASKRSGDPMGPWEGFFEEHGLKYARGEHQNTLTMYGQERDFTYRGQTQRMLKHITLGGGDRKDCVQIYFEPNEDTDQVDVGYCGVHLPYYGQRT